MRRLTSFIGVMLLALQVSGWGTVFAASFCPHAAGIAQLAVMESHCGYRSAEPPHHAGSDHQAMQGMEMMPAVQQHDGGFSFPIGQFAATCLHCMERSNSPFTAVSPHVLSLQKHDAGTPVEKSAMPVASLINPFSPKFIATQNAPPGAAHRKHLLLGVFLI